MLRAFHLFLLTLLPALGAMACSASVDSSGWAIMGQWSNRTSDVWADVEFHRGLQHPISKMNSQGAGCRVLAPPKDAGAGGSGTIPGTNVNIEESEFLPGGIVKITADQTITLTPLAESSYSVEPFAYSSVFHAGQTVTVEIAGNDGDPPAASLSYTAPGQIELTPSAGSQFAFDRGQDATFTWTTTFGDSVLVDFDYGLSCEWSMAKGQGTVPASLLSRLPAETITATFYGQTMHVEDHGRWRIHAGALSFGTPITMTLR